jgi:hypothetical protein
MARTPLKLAGIGKSWYEIRMELASFVWNLREWARIDSNWLGPV